jgi:DNA-binding NtrC family response regulator
MPGTILIIDDEVQLLRHLAHLLRREGYQVVGAHDAAEARAVMPTLYPDVVLVDLKLPDADGTALMSELQQQHPSSGYIIITGHGSIPSAVEATRRGARDYLTKPFEPDELLLAVRNAIRDGLRDEEIRLLRKGGRPKHERRLKGESPVDGEPPSYSEAVRALLARAKQAAATDSTILLLGESGSGKDWMARHIHDRSRRANGPFFSINCAAVPAELAESELFGHEPGAFTGARGRKRGLLELAEGGTLLLNEIGELSMPMQAKLLTFLDTRSFTRVGGETQIKVNARLLAASNRDLSKEVAEGRFRGDLYYRINVLSLRLIPLRERVDDLPALIGQILADLAEEMVLHDPPVVEPEALAALAQYDWPGNIRELRNVLERALMLSESGRIDRASLGLEGQHRETWSYTVNFPENKSMHDLTRDLKRSLIAEALRRADGAKHGAARLLGISRHALAHQMRAIGMEGAD